MRDRGVPSGQPSQEEVQRGMRDMENPQSSGAEGNLSSLQVDGPPAVAVGPGHDVSVQTVLPGDLRSNQQLLHVVDHPVTRSNACGFMGQQIRAEAGIAAPGDLQRISMRNTGILPYSSQKKKNSLPGVSCQGRKHSVSAEDVMTGWRVFWGFVYVLLVPYGSTVLLEY